MDDLSETLPAWLWILLGWLFGGAARVALESWSGPEEGPFAALVVFALWLPAFRRLAEVPGRHQVAFGMTVLATVLLVGLLSAFDGLTLRLPVEIALTVPAGAWWIDRPYRETRSALGIPRA